MRQWTETIKPWPTLCRNRLYRIRVTAIRKSPQAKAIQLEGEFLDGQQNGRKLSETLELPIRPEGRTANYFRACGQEVKLQARVLPKATLGCVIGVRLEQDEDDRWQIIDFEPLQQEKNHEPTNP